MTIEIKKDVQDITIEIVGRLDTTTAPLLEKAINEEVGECKNLILDLKGLEYISSAGLRVMLSTQKKVKEGFKLINVCELVMEVFEMTGFCDVLTIE